jgi:hypothetical protein
MDRRTLCKRIDRKLSCWVLRQVFQCDFGFALPYHKVYDDQTLEYYCPRRVAQSIGEGAKDLGDACFARMGRDEDMLDILRLRGSKLCVRVSVSPRAAAQYAPALLRLRSTFIFVPPFTLFSKELAMGPEWCCSRGYRGSQETARFVGWSRAVEEVAAVLRWSIAAFRHSEVKEY